MSNQPHATEIAVELITLHEFKDRKYRDAWRKRGELIGIFSNIARKYDRLLVAQTEDDPDEAEPRADTSADLCVYAIKYVTWLIEHDPAAATAIPGADPEQWSGTRGHNAVAPALRQLADETTVALADLATAFEAIAAPFTELERILVDNEPTTEHDKAALAWKLASASFAYLWRLALDEPRAWITFTDYVANPA
ncbi:MAG: hypothetical protein WD689_06340 [Gaiellaceae bacterium]